MTFIAESKVSSAACARYYAAGDDIDLAAGYTVKPQSVTTWGATGNWSYNSTTGLFTLSNSHIYLIEADLYVGRIKGQSSNGAVLNMLTDGSGTELADSCRGIGVFASPERYYNAFTKVTDQTTFAIIDGATISSFYWKVESIQSSGGATTVRMNYTGGNGSGSFGVCDSRLVIREYPA